MIVATTRYKRYFGLALICTVVLGIVPRARAAQISTSTGVTSYDLAGDVYYIENATIVPDGSPANCVDIASTGYVMNGTHVFTNTTFNSDLTQASGLFMSLTFYYPDDWATSNMTMVQHAFDSISMNNATIVGTINETAFNAGSGLFGDGDGMVVSREFSNWNITNANHSIITTFKSEWFPSGLEKVLTINFWSLNEDDSPECVDFFPEYCDGGRTLLIDLFDTGGDINYYWAMQCVVVDVVMRVKLLAVDGETIENATWVEVSNSTDTIHNELIGVDGYYRFVGLSVGEYNISYEYGGQQYFYPDTVQTSAGVTTLVVQTNIDFSPTRPSPFDGYRSDMLIIFLSLTVPIALLTYLSISGKAEKRGRNKQLARGEYPRDT